MSHKTVLAVSGVSLLSLGSPRLCVAQVSFYGHSKLLAGSGPQHFPWHPADTVCSGLLGGLKWGVAWVGRESERQSKSVSRAGVPHLRMATAVQNCGLRVAKCVWIFERS